MEKELFAELEASLKEGMAILRGEVLPARIFEWEDLDERANLNPKPSSQNDDGENSIGDRT
jgi:hypothetical protein